MRKRGLIVLAAMAAAVLVSGCSGGSAAGKYPERDINMTVPFNAGGSTDLTGRVVGEAMGRNLGEFCGDQYAGSRWKRGNPVCAEREERRIHDAG